MNRNIKELWAPSPVLFLLSLSCSKRFNDCKWFKVVFIGNGQATSFELFVAKEQLKGVRVCTLSNLGLHYGQASSLLTSSSSEDRKNILFQSLLLHWTSCWEILRVHSLWSTGVPLKQAYSKSSLQWCPLDTNQDSTVKE